MEKEAYIMNDKSSQDNEKSKSIVTVSNTRGNQEVTALPAIRG
jgi:hypothetical protein